MKNVYFVQANLMIGNAHYLPYSVGCIAAYAWQFEEIKSNYILKEFIFKKEPVDNVLNRIRDADIVAFSCNNWSFEYSKELAKRIKLFNSNCCVIFGGHNISPEVDLLSECDFVDYLIFGEGEEPFKQLLDVFSGRDTIENVPNIAYGKNKKTIFTDRVVYKSLNNYVSPYSMGYFDSLIKKNADSEFCAVIETNRGCPYQCAYCDWCYTSKLRQFSLQRVKDDIEWCAKHKIEYIFCADANFGILKRDMGIAEFVVKTKNKYGYPYVFNACFAKNSNQSVFYISKLLYDNHLNKAATLAYQTMNPIALKNVNRQNFTVEAFADLVQKYNEYRIPTYTELILGLPGETYESFCEGLCKLIEAGQHSAMIVYYCQVYNNSLLGSKAYKKLHGIKTAHVKMNYSHASPPKAGDVNEYTDLVVSTNDMPFEDMIKAVMFSTCVQCFHYLGFLKFVAIYLYFEKNITYFSFYQSLLDYIYSSKGTHLNKVFETIRKQCTDFSHGEWMYYDKKFGEIGWYLEEGAFMELLVEFELIWDELMPFLNRFKTDEKVFQQLIKFQKHMIRMPNLITVCENFDYDFHTYFHVAMAGNYSPLKTRKNRISAVIEKPLKTWDEYARKVILFAKKSGGTLINKEKSFHVSYF